MRLEREFSVTIAAELITRDNFMSVAGIGDVIRTSRGAGRSVHDYLVDGRVSAPRRNHH